VKTTVSAVAFSSAGLAGPPIAVTSGATFVT
jgi:hypothetical protein